MLSPKQKNIKFVKKYDILNICDIESGIIVKPITPFDTRDIYELDEKQCNNIELIDETLFIALSTILVNHLSNIQTVQNFIKYNPTLADIKKNKKIWQLYTSLKK